MTPTYYHAETSVYFTAGDAFTLDGTQYPHQVWEDAERIADMGLVPVVDVGTPKDSRYFVNTEQLVGAERRVVSVAKSPEVLAADAAADEQMRKAQVGEKLNRVRQVRELMLGRIIGIKDAARDDGDTVLVDACKAARIGLLQITDNCPTDPALVDQFIKNKYDAITADMPTTLLMAFARLDQ